MSRKQTRGDVTRRRVLQSGAALSGGALVSSSALAQEDGDEPIEDGTDEEPESAVEDTLVCGDVVVGELTLDDAVGFRGEGHHYDAYAFDGEEGEFLTVSMTAVSSDSIDDDTEQDDTEDFDENGDDAEEPEEDENDTEEPAEEEDDPIPQEPFGDPYLYVLAPDGTIIAEDDDSGGGLDAFVTIPSLPESGTYTIVATSWAPEDVFAYELAVECGSPFDPEPIACGDSVQGELTPDDPTGYLSDEHAHDTYEFDGTAGEVVEIAMDGLDDPIDPDCDTTTGADPLLVLLGPEFDVIGRDDDGGDGLNALLNTRLPADGTYTIVATSWAPNLYFTYELSLSCREPLDPEPIACGDVVEAELTSDDESGVRTIFGEHNHDTYAFDGVAGEHVTITMLAERDPNGHEPHEEDYPPGDPYLYLFGPDGQVVAQDDDSAGGLDAMLQHRLAVDGEYVIVATSFGARETFAYELTLDCDDADPDLPEPTPIGCNETIITELSPTDATGFRSPDHFYDHYEFDVEEGDVVTISMSSSEGDSYLLVLDETGEIVAEDDDGGEGVDALLRNLELDAGTYSIIATSFGPGGFFEYDLTVQCL